uniref:Uncharacterized protein n=1 Tax=Glossina palpalis gambiensis TaxID=67801 RepID=A0A1B0B406_9MUSC
MIDELNMPDASKTFQTQRSLLFDSSNLKEAENTPFANISLGFRISVTACQEFNFESKSSRKTMDSSMLLLQARLGYEPESGENHD